MYYHNIMRAFAGMAGAVVLANTALAGERVVMPYRCEAYGREINLTPSEQQPYEIYGRREQDIVTACAPDNPSRCKTWRLHRFDMNCGGTRVPWIDVVAAANALNRGPAKVRNGRLYVRMDPWWARPRPPSWSERPKLREFDDNDWRPDNFRYPPVSRMPSVEMPPGFAPVVGITAQFAEGPPGLGDSATVPGATAQNGNGPAGNWDYGPRSAGSEGIPPSAPKPAAPLKEAVPQAPPAASPQPAPKTSTRDPGHTFAPRSAEAAPVAPKQAAPAEEAAVKGAEQKGATAPDAATPTTMAPAASTAPAPTTASEIAGSGTGAAPTINSLAPTILNRPGAETTAITAATSSSGDTSGPEALPATLESTPGTSGPMSRNGPIVAGVAVMALLCAALAYFLRRQGESQLHTAPAHRDLSAVTLDGAQSRTLAPAQLAQSTPQPPPVPPAAAPAQATNAPPVETFVTGPATEPEWLPATREEALHVLGAGPDASDAVLKKIVDGLRMSWHPDHAKNADDHRLRSERMTQINVAWDILTGRQAAAGPQVWNGPQV